jgi:enoyl-CoA hydratase
VVIFTVLNVNILTVRSDNMENVLFEKRGHAALITIARPKALNALNSETLKELNEALDLISADSDIYCAIITGAGEKAFVAGADISEMKDMNVFEARNFGLLGNKVFRKIELLSIPVIAAVNGFALGGGCELALSCDIRIASENAKFGQPEVGLGITPGFGGTQRLARTVGVPKAKEMIYAGSNINSEEAYRVGLVNRVVPSDKLMDEVFAVANKIAANAPIAVQLCKTAINRGIQADIDTGLNFETEVFAECFASQDQKDAMEAFVEKRKVERFNNK